jgi:hypothetical protein
MGRTIGAVGLLPVNKSPVAACGHAVTVSVRAGDNLLIHKALQLLQPGDVLVVDGGGDVSRALFGEIMMSVAKAKGAVACVFDAAVNMGRDKAVRLLQRACGVAQDGVMGGNTIAAANRLVDPVVRFSAERVIAYTGIRGFDTFGKGWLRRTFTTALEASK